MPSIGAVRDSDDVIDVVSINGIGFGTGNGQAHGTDNVNGTKNGSNGMANGNLTCKLQEINDINEKIITVDDLIRNLAGSGNEKQIKLASELIDLNLVQGNAPENLGPDCFDEISASYDNLSKNVGQENSRNNDNQAKNTGSEANSNETDMEWTTIKPKHKRNRSGSNDSEKIRLETSVSANKKHKSNDENARKIRKTQTNSEKVERTPLNKDSVIVIISDIPDNTYFNSIKMENMVLAAFPRLRESGMWTKYRVNKRHKNKCYITLPKDHHKDNVTDIMKPQSGFQGCKVDVKLGINDVPSKAYKVVAIGVHQSISDEEIIQELGKSNVKVNKV